MQGFTFEVAPVHGAIPTYDMVDAQVNVKFRRHTLTVKVGASNLFGLAPLFDANVPDDERLDRMWNNDVLLVYGGPRVGRLAYVQLITNWTNGDPTHYLLNKQPSILDS